MSEANIETGDIYVRKHNTKDNYIISVPILLKVYRTKLQQPHVQIAYTRPSNPYSSTGKNSNGYKEICHYICLLFTASQS